MLFQTSNDFAVSKGIKYRNIRMTS